MHAAMPPPYGKNISPFDAKEEKSGPSFVDTDSSESPSPREEDTPPKNRAVSSPSPREEDTPPKNRPVSEINRRWADQVSSSYSSSSRSTTPRASSKKVRFDGDVEGTDDDTKEKRSPGGRREPHSGYRRHHQRYGQSSTDTWYRGQSSTDTSGEGPRKEVQLKPRPEGTVIRRSRSATRQTQAGARAHTTEDSDHTPEPMVRPGAHRDPSRTGAKCPDAASQPHLFHYDRDHCRIHGRGERAGKKGGGSHCGEALHTGRNRKEKERKARKEKERDQENADDPGGVETRRAARETKFLLDKAIEVVRKACFSLSPAVDAARAANLTSVDFELPDLVDRASHRNNHDHWRVTDAHSRLVSCLKNMEATDATSAAEKEASHQATVERWSSSGDWSSSSWSHQPGWWYPGYYQYYS